MTVPAPQSVLPEQTVLNIQENSGQIAIGQYVVQIGSVHGGVVNISMPEQPALRPLAVADPALLPPPPDLMLDRVAETEAASRILQTGQIIEFTGEGGIGKTTLLEYLAHHTVAQNFPAGTVYLSARRRLVEDLQQELFDAFHDADPNHPIAVKPTYIQLQRTLRDKKFLIILDDVHLDRDELKELKRLAPGCSLLLAASERHLWRRDEGQTLNLPGLPVENAIDLLEYELGRSLTTEEYNTAKALCLALDGHPDHLIQAAALVREDGRRLPDLARQIQQQGPKALSGQALAALPDPEQQVIQALAALGGAPLSVEHLNAITGLADTGPLIEALLRRGIVQAHSPRYSLVGNLGQLVQQEADLIPWADQALAHFANWAELRQANPDRLLTDLEPLLQSLSWGVRNGYWPRVLRLVRALEGTLALSKYWGAWRRVLQAGLQAAKALGNEAAEAWALHQLGTRALCVGEARLARDFLIQALQLREALGDTAGAAITRHNLELLLPPPPPTDSQPPGDSGPPSGGATSFAPLPLLAGAAATLLPLLLLAWFGWGYLFPTPPPRPSPQSGVRFLPVTATFTPTSTPGNTPAPIVTLPTDTPIPTIPPTFTVLPPSPTSLTPLELTATPTPLPPTATATATATPITPVPVTPGPEISSADPNSTEVGRQVIIRVAGNHFQSNEGGFRVELLGPDSRIALGLDDLRTLTAFEAVVPANLPVGLYDLQVTNPDNRVAFRAAAFEVFDRRLPVVQLLPDRLDFGEQQLNTQSENQTVTLVNIGLADLTLNSISLAGAQSREFNLTHTCPAVLLPNTACTLVVNFRPTATGSRNATISITDNAAGSPHTVFLSGEGILRQPDLVIIELEAAGEPLRNQETNQIDLPIRLVVRNQGDAPANIFKVTTDYTGGRLGATQARSVPFRADASDQVDPQNGIAPSTRLLLPVGAAVTFTGFVSFELEEQGQSLSLSGLADSCNGDTGLPAFCRVEEENENNNRALLVVRLPQFAPQIFEVTPPSAEEEQAVTLTVTGESFRPTEEGFRVTLREGEFETDLALGELRTATTFEALVPPTLPVGQYELQVTNPDESSATEPQAFEVLPKVEALLQLVPEQLVFPPQELDTAGEPQQVSLTNIGTAILIFEQISPSGDPDFQVSHDCPSSLAPQASCTLTVSFTPLKPGDRQGRVDIVSNATGSPHQVLLSGTGILSQPDLIIEQFGALGAPVIDPKAGRADLPVEVVVKNEGDAPADPFELSLERFREIEERGRAGPAQNGDQVPFMISPSDAIEPRGDGRVITRLPLPAGQSLTFRGSARFDLLEEEQSLLLLAVADGCEAEEGLPAFCRVAEQDETNNLSTLLRVLIPAAPHPRLTLEPGFLLFPGQEVGTRSRSQNVLLTNTGSADLALNSLSLAGAHPADFVLSHTCPFSLAPAGACALSLVFVPTVAGQRNGLVSIIDTAEGSPHTVSLAGIAIALPDPAITRVDPARGEVNQGLLITVEGENFDPRPGFRVELFDAQERANLVLGELRTESRFEAFVPATLPAGLYDLQVTNPDGRSGLKTRALELTEQRLSVVQLMPPRLLFPGQKVNTASPAEQITLTNVGSADLLINNITLAGVHPADFILDPACPVALPPGNSCLLLASFSPLAIGSRTAELRLASNAPDSPVGSSRVDLQACKLEYSIVSPK